jgi:hypothetical protein
MVIVNFEVSEMTLHGAEDAQVITSQAEIQMIFMASVTDGQSVFAWIGGAHQGSAHRVDHDCLAAAHG